MDDNYLKMVKRYALLDKWIEQMDQIEGDTNKDLAICIDTAIDHYLVDSDLLNFMVGSARMDIESEHAALYSRIKKHNMST